MQLDVQILSGSDTLHSDWRVGPTAAGPTEMFVEATVERSDSQCAQTAANVCVAQPMQTVATSEWSGAGGSQ